MTSKGSGQEFVTGFDQYREADERVNAVLAELRTPHETAGAYLFRLLTALQAVQERDALLKLGEQDTLHLGVDDYSEIGRTLVRYSRKN